jgi:hypothetical protein
MTRSGIRVLAVIVALIVSSKQSRFFDCNKLMGLSVIAGVVTLLLVYGVGERGYSVLTSSRSKEEKLRDGAVVLLGGGVLIGLAGFFTMMTHLCP